MIPIVIHGLHQLPNIYIELVLILFNLALFVAAPLALRRALHIEIHEDVAKGADDAFKTLVALTMAMTAFALVQVEGLHRNVGDLVSREGAILLKFDRTIEDFGGPLAPAAEQRLRDYAASVRQSEWPAMASGGRSADTSARLSALSASVDQGRRTTRTCRGSCPDS